MSETPEQPEPNENPDMPQPVVYDLDRVREELAQEFGFVARGLTSDMLNPRHKSRRYTDEYTRGNPEDRLGPMRDPDDPSPEAT